QRKATQIPARKGIMRWSRRRTNETRLKAERIRIDNERSEHEESRLEVQSYPRNGRVLHRLHVPGRFFRFIYMVSQTDTGRVSNQLFALWGRRNPGAGFSQSHPGGARSAPGPAA